MLSSRPRTSVRAEGPAFRSVGQGLDSFEIDSQTSAGNWIGSQFQQGSGVELIPGIALGIYKKDAGDTHAFVIAKLLQSPGHRVFGRENLENRQRRLRDDLLNGPVAVQDGNV